MSRKKKNRQQKRMQNENARILLPKKKEIILPSGSPYLALPPFMRRKPNPPLRFPRRGSLEAANLQRIMDRDIAFQMSWRTFEKRFGPFVFARLSDGSGLQMAKVLRWYLNEYLRRFIEHGPDSMPSSYSVVQAFLNLRHKDTFFDLREEVDHLLSVNEFFHWYDAGKLPRDPRVLEDVMAEGKIYSYDMVRDSGSLRISGISQQLLAGVAFVRHRHRLSCILLAGENPPRDADDDVQKIDWDATDVQTGREDIQAHPKSTVKDRYLDGNRDFARVIVLTRFDLRAARHDVRFVNLDAGSAYVVLTDDFEVLDGLPSAEVIAYRESVIEGLKRYDDLFAALSVLMFLPAFFAGNIERVETFDVATEMHTKREETATREVAALLGNGDYKLSRTIHFVPTTVANDETTQLSIDPPAVKFAREGHWKAIGPQEIGDDEEGNKVVGRTWVSRHESWSARSPQAFLLRRSIAKPVGPDPGTIYIQRSPAHGMNVFKIGLTRKDPDGRAEELSSATAVPLPMDVLGTWNVGDCALVEREVHLRLDNYRINPRREFFVVELSVIIRTIEAVAKQLG